MIPQKKVILLLVPDLVARTAIKGAVSQDGVEVISIRSLEDLKVKINELSDNNSLRLVVDLNHLTLDPFLAISESLSKTTSENIISFYSHVDQELKERAQDLGISKIYPRSKFFNCIADLLD